VKDKSTQRRIGITLAVILGLFALLYLGGLLGQMLGGYQTWLDQGGLTGKATIPPPDFNFLTCLFNVFSEYGLKGLGIATIAVAALIVYIKFHDRFGSHDLDDRNFARSKSGTYGTAGWMSNKEMKKVLEVTTPAKAQGIILGQKNGSVICLPRDTRLNRHILAVGATGTMKSRAIVRNLLFQSIKNGESVLCTDPKGELYNDTAELFRQNGYQVKVFNLVNPDYSDSWNCMSDMLGDTMMAQVLTNVIIENTAKDGKGDPFWDNGEALLLKSLVLYVDQNSMRGADEKHLPAVYQMLINNSDRELANMFGKLPTDHPAKAPYNLFAQASDSVRQGIIIGLGTRLQVLQNKSIQKIISHSDIDLTEPGKNKCAYFVILSDQENSTEFLSSLFFSFLFIKLTRYADSMPDGRCKVPVNIIFEELNNVGTLDSYPRRLSVARSRGLQICHIIQSLAQFQNRYPDKQWAEIIGNCDTQLMLGCTEEESAELFSMRSGDMTVEVNSTMTVRKTIAVAQMIPQYRHTEGQGRRRLMTTDEVLRLPNEELLIIMRGQKVLKAEKFDYTGHPYAKKMIRTSIFDYKSQYTPPETEPDTQPPIQDDAVPEPRKPKRGLASQTETETGNIEQPSGTQSLNESNQPPSEF